MSKKLLTTAEHLSSLDMLIAKKKEGKKEFTYDEIIIIIIIIFGGHPIPNPRIMNDYPQFDIAEKLSAAVQHVVQGASVEDLLQLRKSVETK